ncbi:MAG: hypothetical protein M3Z98_10110 [Candidatus Dormibacteraeota bacterium]|nr:hypothetical protein [Candidatus Dormibacteraeota bacterium]
MRGFFAGLVLVPLLVVAVLSIRPGGLRRQLSLAGRRLRVLLTLAGAYFICAAIIRLVFPSGPVSDYGPPAVAIVLAAAYLVLAQDPVSGSGSGS